MSRTSTDIATIMRVIRGGETCFVEDIVAEYLHVMQKLGVVAHVLSPTFLSPNDNKVHVIYVDDV